LRYHINMTAYKLYQGKAHIYNMHKRSYSLMMLSTWKIGWMTSYLFR